MILVFFVAAGLLVGVVRAAVLKAAYKVPRIRNLWLLLLALFLQAAVFTIPITRELIPIAIVKIVHITSLCMLMIFSIANLDLPGFGIIAAGVFANLLVITLNGGLMPISPGTVLKILHGQPTAAITLGLRFGMGKDIVLETGKTTLWFLSDCLTLPRAFPYQVAFSAGDCLIGIGIFWLLADIPAIQKGEIPWYSMFRQKYFKEQQQELDAAPK